MRTIILVAIQYPFFDISYIRVHKLAFFILKIEQKRNYIYGQHCCCCQDFFGMNKLIVTKGELNFIAYFIKKVGIISNPYFYTSSAKIGFRCNKML